MKTLYHKLIFRGSRLKGGRKLYLGILSTWRCKKGSRKNSSNKMSSKLRKHSNWSLNQMRSWTTRKWFMEMMGRFTSLQKTLLSKTMLKRQSSSTCQILQLIQASRLMSMEKLSVLSRCTLASLKLWKRIIANLVFAPLIKAWMTIQSTGITSQLIIQKS